MTGGSRGIGRAVAAALAEHNCGALGVAAPAAIVLTARDGDAAAQVAETLQGAAAAAAAGGEGHAHGAGCAHDSDELRRPRAPPAVQVRGVPCDVRDPAAVAAMVTAAEAEFGPTSMLVNAAGVARDSLLLRCGDDDVDDVVRTNLLGSLYCCRAAARSMLRQRHGAIVNVGSVVGARGNAGQAAYSASKAALVGLTRSLSKELAPRGVRVNCVEPGFIDTDMTAGACRAAAVAAPSPRRAPSAA